MAVDDQGRVVIGRFTGPAYPFGPSWAGTLGPKPDVNVIFTSIANILTTALGSYPPNPNLGSVVPDSVFEPNDDITRSVIQRGAEDDISRQDDRINVTDVRTFVPDDPRAPNRSADDPHTVRITTSFEIIGDEAGKIFNAPITFNLSGL